MVKKVQKEYLTSKSDCSRLHLFFYCFLSLFQVGASWWLKQSPPPPPVKNRQGNDQNSAGSTFTLQFSYK
jgi:hypothetical protein